MAEAFALVRHGRLSLADLGTMTREERLAYMAQLSKYADAMAKAASPRG